MTIYVKIITLAAIPPLLRGHVPSGLGSNPGRGRRGVGAARVPRGCRPGQPAASLRHEASQFLASAQPGMPVYVSERPRVGRRAPAPVASGVSAIARCTEGGPARWWYNSTAPRREDATSWRLCRGLGLAPGARFVRHCVAVSTLEGDLVLDPGRLHHARSP